MWVDDLVRLFATAEPGKQSITLIGQYDLWVRKGVISLYGAILTASPKLHRVYAPATHALPVLQSVTNPYGRYGEPAEVRIISTKSRIRMLKDLSLEFGKLWNEKIKTTDSGANLAKRSFSMVSFSDNRSF